MSRQIIRNVKPRVRYVPRPSFLPSTRPGPMVWVCEGMGIRAYSHSARGAVRLYAKVAPHQFYKEFA